MKKPQTKLRHTVKTSDSFPVFFSECSSHFCQVVVHPTLKTLRRTIAIDSEYSNYTDSDLEAFCIIHNTPKDSLVATIHLCREALACSHICHECLHAAWHRAKVLGIKDDDDFQEFVAYGQASLLTQIADWLNENP